MKIEQPNLDELQQRKKLEIESLGFRLALVGVYLLTLTSFVIGTDPRGLYMENGLALALSLYSVIAHIRAGIWDSSIAMTRKNCLILALIVASAFSSFIMLSNLGMELRVVLSVGAISWISCFLIGWPFLLWVVQGTRRRQKKLNAEPEADSN